MSRQTVRYARSHLDRWSASRILVPSVPCPVRANYPWIQGPHGNTVSAPAMRAGYVGRK